MTEIDVNENDQTDGSVWMIFFGSRGAMSLSRLWMYAKEKF